MVFVARAFAAMLCALPAWPVTAGAAGVGYSPSILPGGGVRGAFSGVAIVRTLNPCGDDVKVGVGGLLVDVRVSRGSFATGTRVVVGKLNPAVLTSSTIPTRRAQFASTGVGILFVRGTTAQSSRYSVVVTFSGIRGGNHAEFAVANPRRFEKFSRVPGTGSLSLRTVRGSEVAFYRSPPVAALPASGLAS